MRRAGPLATVSGDPSAEVEGAGAEAIARDLSQHPISLALAFGSRVSGSPLPWSDLDLAVRFDDDVTDEERLRLLDRIAADVEALTEADSVDVVELDRIGPHRAYRALHEGVLLLGEEDDRQRAEARYLQRKIDFERVRETWREGLDERIEGGRYGRA